MFDLNSEIHLVDSNQKDRNDQKFRKNYEYVEFVVQMIHIILDDCGHDANFVNDKLKIKVHWMPLGSALFCFSKSKQNSLFIGGLS